MTLAIVHPTEDKNPDFLIIMIASYALLNKRNITMMAGMTYVPNTELGFLRTILAGDMLDKSNSIVWDLEWLYSYSIGRQAFTPGIGL